MKAYVFKVYESYGYMHPPNRRLLMFRRLPHLVECVKWRALPAAPTLHRMVDQLLADWLFDKKP